MEIDESYYENLTVTRTYDYDEIIRALEVVKRYIIYEKRIITGGMSIDYALKLKGEKGIYDDDILPDYDFFSPAHHVDAYRLAEKLQRKGFKNISVINALHPSTMRVRVNFVVVADITFVHEHILKNIPTLKYKGIFIIHPHVQMIDQHRALSFPYENAPWETIVSSRPRKDMKRYDILYNLYPLRMLFLKDKNLELYEKFIPKELLENQCITGFFALNYWIKESKKLGFKTDLNFGDFEIVKEKIKYSIPIDSHGISLYSDNIEEVYNLIKSVYKPKEERFYEQFLDKLPRKIILDNNWELLENDEKITASKEWDNVYIANLQNVMMYLMVNYILLMKIKNIKRGYSFYIGYLECRNLVTWAANKYTISTHNDTKKSLQKFLPTYEVYGSKNLSKSYIVSKHRFDIKNKTLDIKEKSKYSQPSNIYDRDLRYGRIHKSFYSFDPNKSEIFNFSGNEVDKFF